MKTPTTLRILRDVLKLNQTQLAKLICYSTVAIKKVERGGGPMTELIALMISERTGVCMNWLMENDSTKPIVATGGEPYTREHYDQVAAGMMSEAGLGSSLDAYHRIFPQIVAKVLKILLVGYNKGKPDLACFKILMRLKEIEADFKGADVLERRAIMLSNGPNGMQAIEDMFHDELSSLYRRKLHSAGNQAKEKREKAAIFEWAKTRKGLKPKIKPIR